jgi:hypothetical protein
MENKMTKTQKITLAILIPATFLTGMAMFVLTYLEMYVWGK